MESAAKKSFSFKPKLRTSVVNVKVLYIRPGFDNLKEWMSDPKNVYIGRKGIVFIDGQRFPKQDSLWANPFKAGKDGDREEILTKYEDYIRDRIDEEKITLQDLNKLLGKTLGCWCVSEKTFYSSDESTYICHGCILLKLLEEYSDKNKIDK